jgi:fucokinase
MPQRAARAMATGAGAAGGGTGCAAAAAAAAAADAPLLPLLQASAPALAACGGLEVETFSLLPAGSGLGGSSVLAAAVLAALAHAAGARLSRGALVHLVLKLEALMSTGGGWQDQVGGVYGGAKLSACAAGLPVRVSVAPLGAAPPPPSEPAVGASAPSSAAAATSAAQLLGRHLLLIYTGRTRLAKNLLQRVLRAWALRDAAVTAHVRALRANAAALSDALSQGDVAAAGACLSTYWAQKKGMAEGAEPPEVAALMRLLAEAGLVHGCALAGAGGGGFMALLTVAPAAAPGGRAAVEALLQRHPELQSAGFTVHGCEVDEDGLTVTVEEAAAAAAAAEAGAGAGVGARR